jgi:hypothetical protein
VFSKIPSTFAVCPACFSTFPLSLPSFHSPTYLILQPMYMFLAIHFFRFSSLRNIHRRFSIYNRRYRFFDYLCNLRENITISIIINAFSISFVIVNVPSYLAPLGHNITPFPLTVAFLNSPLYSSPFGNFIFPFPLRQSPQNRQPLLRKP